LQQSAHGLERRGQEGRRSAAALSVSSSRGSHANGYAAARRPSWL
jgi:hypothetical protein